MRHDPSGVKGSPGCCVTWAFGQPGRSRHPGPLLAARSVAGLATGFGRQKTRGNAEVWGLAVTWQYLWTPPPLPTTAAEAGQGRPRHPFTKCVLGAYSLPGSREPAREQMRPKPHLITSGTGMVTCRSRSWQGLGKAGDGGPDTAGGTAWRVLGSETQGTMGPAAPPPPLGLRPENGEQGLGVTPAAPTPTAARGSQHPWVGAGLSRMGATRQWVVLGL